LQTKGGKGRGWAAPPARNPDLNPAPLGGTGGGAGL